MKRKSVIVLENTNPKAFDEKIECFGNFKKKMCLEKEFPYHSLKMLKFPITYKNSVIYKVEFKQQVWLVADLITKINKYGHNKKEN